MRAVKRSGHSDDSQADNVSEGDSMSAVSESSEEEDHDGRESRLGRAYVGSIASTYWRPERNDRGGLSAVDERCAFAVCFLSKPSPLNVFQVMFFTES